MNLAALADELFAVLEGVPGLNVPTPGVGNVSPPAPYVELPEVVYGEHGAGLDGISDLGLTVFFGPANNPRVFRDALTYASTTGDRSIPAALLAHRWTSCHTLRPGRAEPVIDTAAGSNPMLGYTFHLEITGSNQ